MEDYAKAQRDLIAAEKKRLLEAENKGSGGASGKQEQDVSNEYPMVEGHVGEGE